MNDGILYLLRLTPRVAVRRIRRLGWLKGLVYVGLPILFVGPTFVAAVMFAGAGAAEAVRAERTQELVRFMPGVLLVLATAYVPNRDLLPLRPWEADRLLSAPVDTQSLNLLAAARYLASGLLAGAGLIPIAAFLGAPVGWAMIAIPLAVAISTFQGALAGRLYGLWLDQFDGHGFLARLAAIFLIVGPAFVQAMSSPEPGWGAFISAPWFRWLSAPALLPTHALFTDDVPSRIMWLAVSGLVLKLGILFVVRAPVAPPERIIQHAHEVLRRFRAVSAGTRITPAARDYRVRLPVVRRLGPVGLLLWRKTTSILRMSVTNWFIPVFVAGAVLAPSLMSKPEPSATLANHVVYGVHLLLLALVLSTAMGFDLRHAWSHMDVLRRLPVGAASVVIAEVLPATVAAWLVQMVAAAIAAWHLGVSWAAFGAAIAVSPWVLWLFYALHNMAALWFPAPPTSGPSYNFVVRTMLATAIAYAVIGLLLGVSVIAGYGAWTLTESRFATALVPLAANLVFNVGTTWALVRTFERFEPAADSTA